MDQEERQRHISGLQESLSTQEWIMELNREFPSTEDLNLPMGVGGAARRLGHRIMDRLEVAIATKGIPFSPRVVSALKTQLRGPGMMEEIVHERSRYLTLLRDRDWYRAVKLLLPPDEDTKCTAISQLRQHWTDKYYGQSLAAFRDKLSNAEHHWGEQEYYAKTFCIVQSSGTGKSRLIEEFGKGVMTMSFALRKEGDTGFPPGDEEIYKFLSSPFSRSVNLEIHARAISLLGAIVQTILAWYIQNHSHPNMLQEWSSMLAPLSHENPGDYGDVGDGGVAAVNDNYRSEFRKKLCRDIVNLAEKIMVEIMQASWDWSRNYEYEKCLDFTIHLHDPLQQLLGLLKKSSIAGSSLPPLVLAFDETANLNSKTNAALSRVMRSLRRWPVWAVFLSTNSEIGRFAPPQPKDPSARIVRGELKRVRPFLGLELDIKAREQFITGHELAKPVRQFSTTTHMTMFGRPLWQVWSTSQYAELRRFVVFKLLCGQGAFKPHDCQHVFAVLASRLCLDPCLNREESNLLAKEAVNSHLRLLSAIDTYLGVVRTVTPSEPVVADAAAWLLLQSKPGPSASGISASNWPECLTLFSEHFLSRGMVDKGVKGELYARLICILTRDYLLEETVPSIGLDQECTYSRPFLCHDFLERLIGKPILEELITLQARRAPSRDRKKEIPILNDTDDDLQALLRTGYMNFNHFSQTQKPVSPETIQDLLHGLLRQHCALQLCFGQHHWDLLIPIYFGDLDQGFDASQLSAVLLQVNNRANRAKVPLGKEYREMFTGWNPRLVISVQMELGVMDSAIETTIRWPELGTGEPCIFGIRVLGGGKETYPVLRKHGLEDACARLMKTLVSENSGIESIICEKMVRFNSHTHKERYTLGGGDTEPEDVSMGGV